MKIRDLSQGEIASLSILPLDGELPRPHPIRGEEVTLRFPQGVDLGLLRWGQEKMTVAPEGDGDRQILRVIREQDPPRLLWVTQLDARAGRVTLQMHRFGRHLLLPDGLKFGVDERILDRIQKLRSRNTSMEDACIWLTEQVQLPPREKDGLPRLLATGDPEGGDRFRLLGEQIAVDVLIGGGLARVERIVSHRPQAQSFSPPVFLIDASVTFQDGSVAGGMRAAIQAQLKEIVEASEGSYFRLWTRYQALEDAQLKAEARAVGALAYERVEAKASGRYRFVFSRPDAFSDFVGRLAPGEVQLEAGKALPPELLDGSESSEEKEGKEGEHPFVGTVQDIRWHRAELDLFPLDEDRAPSPPKSGFLYPSLRGDRVRLRRREEAIQRMKSADAPMPQLALIIEGEAAPEVRRDAVKALSPESRKHFRHAPTQAQREAMDFALNTPDIALIQGPPGTGKTTVIAALQARLAELEERGQGASAPILLTSFQHDAVDNAAQRTRVLGLPPARFGGKGGANPVEAQAERFAAEAVAQLKATLTSRPEGRPLSIYRRLRDQVAHYAGGAGEKAEAQTLLEELLALPAETLPESLWGRLRDLRRSLRRPPPEDDSRRMALRVTRGIRTDAAAFGDDGPSRAGRALNVLGDTLTDEDRALLSAARDVPLGEVFSRLEELASLRESLLAELTLEKSAALPMGPDPQILKGVVDVVAHLRARLESSASGVDDALEELADTLLEEPGAVIETLRQYSRVFAATCQQSVGQAITRGLGQDGSRRFETVIVDEAARANPLDLFIPLSLAGRRVVLVGDHRQLPHLLEPSIERQLAEDPGGAMTAALKESLFQRLFEDLKARGGPRRVVTLDQQFRMHPTLGGFISDVFYAPFGEAFRSPRPASDFHHPLGAWSRGGRPLCAGWKDIPLSHGREQRAGTSWRRPEEARWIAAHVAGLLEGGGKDMTVGVITFYAAQVKEVLGAMAEHGLTEADRDSGALQIARHWRDLERPDGSREERLRVGTVDAFQGMEFDVVLLSVVRSNPNEGGDPAALRRRFGHLLLANRLCVAMSRQRRLLIVVGDRAMFDGEIALSSVPGLAQFLTLCRGDDGLLT